MRSYYLLRSMAASGRPALRRGNQYRHLDAGRLFARTIAGGAWERDQLGNWINPCTPGGEPQRRDAFHLGINLILYAMTENYKDDLIHVAFIQRRLSR